MVTRTPSRSWLDQITEARPLRDPDITAVQEWLQRNDLDRLGKDVTQQAIDLIAQEARFTRCENTSTACDGTVRLGSAGG